MLPSAAFCVIIPAVVSSDGGRCTHINLDILFGAHTARHPSVEHMKILENIKLAQYTTFKIGGPARFFCSVASEKELEEAVAFAKKQKIGVFVLGEGSNVLISDKGLSGLVVKMEIKGIKKEELGASTRLSVGAGEMWDTLVDYAVSHKLYGIENLSAIPGTVGAAPVQNIGAYGSEISETVEKVRAYDIHKGKFIDFSKTDCKFRYRESIFKDDKRHYIITRVDLILTNNGEINTKYRDLNAYFGDKKPSLEEVRKAVIEIRWNKLPDWRLWGTAGSFFKNPVIAKELFDRLKAQYAELPGFPEPDGRIKVPLGWVLDKVCNMKGICVGNVCTYEKQALVLVAKPGATSEEVVQLSHDIMTKVKDKTGIEIEGEVEWVN